MDLFRTDLLEGRTIAVAGSLPSAAMDALRALGAQLEAFEPTGDEDADQDWVRTHGPVHALIHDARGPFAGGGGPEALRDALEQAWVACRAVANGALIPAEVPGKLILVMPAPDAGEHAEPVRDALENLARTLSVEWARHRITAVAIAPGNATTDEQLVELLGYLCSPAGDYYSGCRLELGGLGAATGS